MYFSYSPSPSSTSYSASPMDMPSSLSSQPHSPSCAYPSWPQGPFLSTGRSGSQSTSFIISDEELFAIVFSDSDVDCSPPATPNSIRSPASPSMLWEPRVMVDEHGSQMRDLIAQEKTKKEKRRRQKSVSKKSKPSSDKHMSPILE